MFNCSLRYTERPRAIKEQVLIGRRILVAFQHHQLLPFNSKLAEPERFKETRRFNIVFTDHFVLFTAKDSDT